MRRHDDRARGGHARLDERLLRHHLIDDVFERGLRAGLLRTRTVLGAQRFPLRRAAARVVVHPLQRAPHAVERARQRRLAKASPAIRPIARPRPRCAGRARSTVDRRGRGRKAPEARTGRAAGCRCRTARAPGSRQSPASGHRETRRPFRRGATRARAAPPAGSAPSRCRSTTRCRPPMSTPGRRGPRSTRAWCHRAPRRDDPRIPRVARIESPDRALPRRTSRRRRPPSHRACSCRTDASPRCRSRLRRCRDSTQTPAVVRRETRAAGPRHPATASAGAGFACRSTMSGSICEQIPLRRVRGPMGEDEPALGRPRRPPLVALEHGHALGHALRRLA